MVLGLFGGLGMMVIISLVFIYCHDYLLRPGFFKARTLVVKGAKRLSEKAVLTQAGIHPGINILSVNLRISRKRLLAHPWIERARIKREIPGGLFIHIKEHQPVAVVDLGRQYLMNGKGILFIKKGRSFTQPLPMVSGLKYSDMNIPLEGPTRELKKRGHDPLAAVVGLFSLGMKASGPLSNDSIQHVRVDRKTGLTVFTMGKEKTIKLGYDQYPEKLRALKNIMTRLRRQKKPVISDFKTIDLTRLDRIVVKPANRGTS